MLASVVLVPSAPLLVPELAGPAATDTQPVRAATVDAAVDLGRAADRWVVIGSGSAVTAPAGSFRRYGVDRPVSLTGRPPARTDPSDEQWPLSLLIGAWLREQAGASRVLPRLIDPAADPADCVALGDQIATEIGDETGPIGVLVVGDGAISLSPRAPGGGLDPAAVALQERLDAALGGADLAALAALSPQECADHGVDGRAPWQVAAALVAASLAGRLVKSAETRYAAAPFGVGYTVAVWQVQP